MSRRDQSKQAVASKPHVLFSGIAEYTIAEGAQMDSVLDDALCWLGSANGIVEALASGLEDTSGDMAANPQNCAAMLYGVSYLLNMVHGAVLANQLAGIRQGGV